MKLSLSLFRSLQYELCYWKDSQIPFLSLSVLNHFRYADDVSIGDEVLVQGEDDELTPAKVIDLSSSTMQGDILWRFLF